MIVYLDNTIESQFQFWLTITFAVIVAAYSAGHRLKGSIRLVISALYFMSCALCYWRYVGAVENMQDVLAALAEMNSLLAETALGPWPGYLRRTVMVLGTLFGLVAINFPKLGATGIRNNS